MKGNYPILKKVNHIGIVVKNLDEALESYSRGLGLQAEGVVEIPDVGLRIAVLKIGGIEIELLEYQNLELPVVKALRGHHPGINHVCYEVSDFKKAIENLKANGFQLVEGFPRKGVHGMIAFFIPSHSSEERLEILEVE
jgi:methylmalonyl-CoA epimerase